MRIPLGNFEQPGAGAAPVQHTRISGEGLNAGNQALAELGGVGAQIANQQLRQRNAEAEALARAKAANAMAAHQIEIQTVVDDVGDQLRRGADYTKAGELYDQAVAKIKAPQIAGLPPEVVEDYQGGLSNAARAGRLKVDGIAVAARRDDGQRQFVTAIDLAGKAAAHPAADIAAINERLRQSEEFFIAGFGLDRSATTKAIQDRIDANWSGQAAQRFNEGHDDSGALQQLLTDLTDEKGSYVDKLDPDKRSAIALRVSSRLDVLQAKAERAQDRANSAAERALAQMDEQSATGIPHTVEQWDSWSGAVKAASPEYQEAFRQRIQDEKDIQSFLHQPIEAQLRGIAERQAKLMTEGGDKRAIANTRRVATAVQANVKLLTENPLQYLAAREGEQIDPLDLQSLADPTQQGAVAAQLQQRATLVANLRKTKGAAVQMRLLLPSEAAALTGVMDKATPENQAKMFGQLRRLAGSDSSYRAIMQQLAPDSPVRALAGMIYAEQRSTVLQNNLIRSDKTATSGDVARLILQGEAMLNKSAGDKAIDGKSTPFPIPAPKEFGQEFAARVGGAFANRPGSYETAMQAVRAYYAGRSAEQGDVSGELDPARLGESVRAVLGEPVDVGGSAVFPPWGMDEDEFSERLEQSWVSVTSALPKGLSRDLDDYALQQRGGNSYYVVGPGGGFVMGKSGDPLVLTVTR